MKITNLLVHFMFLCCSLFLVCCDRQESLDTMANTAPEYAGTIIAVGDSLTAGLGVGEPDAWPAILENKLRSNGYNWQVINGGISGETSTGTLSRINWILAQKPDIVILETGANDGFRGIEPEFIQENISKAVQLLQEGEVTVILAGMQIVQNLGKDYTDKFAEIYPWVAEKTGCVLIPFFLDKVAGEPSLNQDDVIHPNEKGHRIIVETIYPFAVEAVRQQSKE